MKIKPQCPLNMVRGRAYFRTVDSAIRFEKACRRSFGDWIYTIRRDLAWGRGYVVYWLPYDY